MSGLRLPVFLLPGLMCDHRVWTSQLEELADHDVRAVQGYRGARTLPDMASAVLENAPPKFLLAGHSMGARVALEIYRAVPDRVTGLALIDTGVHPVRPGEADGRCALLALGREQGIEALVDRWLPPMVHEPNRANAEMMTRLRMMSIEAGIDQFEAQINAMLTRPEVESLLPRISVPTLVGVGRQDAWSPVSQHEAIAAAIKGSRLVIFEDAGHMAPAEAPAAATAALRTWIEAR